jgi:hypothetical protein
MTMDILMDTESEDKNQHGMFMAMKSQNIFKIRLEKTE